MEMHYYLGGIEQSTPNKTVLVNVFLKKDRHEW